MLIKVRKRYNFNMDSILYNELLTFSRFIVMYYIKIKYRFPVLAYSPPFSPHSLTTLTGKIKFPEHEISYPMRDNPTMRPVVIQNI